jgi:hypothetical protein
MMRLYTDHRGQYGWIEGLRYVIDRRDAEKVVEQLEAKGLRQLRAELEDAAATVATYRDGTWTTQDA